MTVSFAVIQIHEDIQIGIFSKSVISNKLVQFRSIYAISSNAKIYMVRA